MANSTIAIDNKTLSAIYRDLNTLTKVIFSLAEKLGAFSPTRFGSKIWWKKELNEALKAMEAGHLTEYPSEKAYLAELKKREQCLPH